MLLPHGTVIAVVDGEGWDLYRNAGNEAAPELSKIESPALEEGNHSVGGHGASRSRTSPHQQDEAAHAVAVAEWLNRQVSGHKIEHLVVIAPPKTLGELRHRWSKPVENALLGEIAKDLIGRQPADLIAALRGK
ncbi:MAG: hypothetical protein RIS94_3312 [Pseudomonadota bacterium]|jgi:protein required for attachment to host cells